MYGRCRATKSLGTSPPSRPAPRNAIFGMTVAYHILGRLCYHGSPDSSTDARTSYDGGD